MRVGMAMTPATSVLIMSLFTHPFAFPLESQAHLLIEIEDFVTRVISGRVPLGGLNSLQSAGSPLEEADQYERLIRRFLTVYQPGYRYSEHVQAFWNACAAMGWLHPDCEGMALPEMHFPGWQGVDSLRYLLALLQSEARSPAFLRAVHDRDYALRERNAVLEQYARALTAYYCRLLVVRLDVGYLWQAQRQVTIDDVYAHLEMFNRLRYSDPVFEHLVGSTWCLEQGRLSGYHGHLTYFFNGSAVQNGWYKGKAIGGLWKHTTRGIGRFHVCNGDEFHYPRRGIGMIHRSSPQECANLEYVMSYVGEFDKEPQYLRMRPEGSRTFGTGQAPSLANKRGRPPYRGAGEGEGVAHV